MELTKRLRGGDEGGDEGGDAGGDAIEDAADRGDGRLLGSFPKIPGSRFLKAI